MRELAQAQEDLKLAQADFAQVPGLLFYRTNCTTTGITRVLTGDFRAGRLCSAIQQRCVKRNIWLNAMTGFVPAQQQATAATEQHAVAAYFQPTPKTGAAPQRKMPQLPQPTRAQP